MPDAWYESDKVKIVYEISFRRYFYKPEPMRPLEDIRTAILVLDVKAERILVKIIGEHSS